MADDTGAAAFISSPDYFSYSPTAQDVSGIGPPLAPTDYTPVVPYSMDTMVAATAAAGGAPFVPQNSGITGDSSGVNALHNDPRINPTPNGGWQSVAQGILNSAAKGFSTFVSGSPSVGIPIARNMTGRPIGGILTTSTGQTNWAMLAVVGGALAIGIWALVKYA